MTTFLTKRSSVSFKTRILSVLVMLISKKYEDLDVIIPWKVLWNESLNLVMRLKKYESVSSDEISAKYTFKLVS